MCRAERAERPRKNPIHLDDKYDSPEHQQLLSDNCKGDVVNGPMTARETDEVQATLDEAGLTWFSLEVFLMAGLGWMADGAESAVMGYMLPSLLHLYDLDERDLGFLGALVGVGMALGGVFWGCLADSHGRRTSFLWSVGLTAVLGALSACATSVASYCALRAATGFAIGGNLPLAVATVNELFPSRYREPALVALHMFYEIGALASTGLAAWALPETCDSGSLCLWRTYLFMVALPAAVTVPVAYWRLPESPSWLRSRGRYGEMRQTLSHIRGTKHDPVSHATTNDSCGGYSPLILSGSDEMSQSRQGYGGCNDNTQDTCGHGINVEETVQLSSVKERLFHLLCSAELRVTTFTVLFLWMCADMASGWWTWTPTFAAIQGVDAQWMYLASSLGRCVASLAFLVATAVVKRVGARRLLVIALVCTTTASAFLTVWVRDTDRFASASFLVVYGIFSFFFGGAWPVMYVVTPAAFPTEVRGTGFGMASSAGKFGSICGPLVVGTFLVPSILRVGSFFTVTWAVTACLALAVAWRHRPQITGLEHVEARREKMLESGHVNDDDESGHTTSDNSSETPEMDGSSTVVV